MAPGSEDGMICMVWCSGAGAVAVAVRVRVGESEVVDSPSTYTAFCQGRDMERGNRGRGNTEGRKREEKLRKVY